MGNEDQAAFWSGDAGATWVAKQAAMDQLLQPVLDRTLELAALARGQKVLDVGCGTGHSTLKTSEVTGGSGMVIGADISPTMLSLARKRAGDAPGVAFLEGDVAVHAFAPAQFDRVLSRFGVMFFADPVAAFQNMARAAKPGARLAIACWGQIEENPYFTLPARIAREIAGAPPKSDPDAPGPFAFRDPAKATDILARAGWSEPNVKVEHLELSLPERARALARLCAAIGPAARAFTHFESDTRTRQKVENKLAEAISALPREALPAQINFFTARKALHPASS